MENKMMENEIMDCELNEDELDVVAGGGAFWTAVGCVVGGGLAASSLGLGILAGAAIACGGHVVSDLTKKKR